jgi:hypothetical protein
MSLRGRLRNLEREANVSLVVVEHGDGKTSRFRGDTHRSKRRVPGTSPIWTIFGMV